MGWGGGERERWEMEIEWNERVKDGRAQCAVTRSGGE